MKNSDQPPYAGIIQNQVQRVKDVSSLSDYSVAPPLEDGIINRLLANKRNLFVDVSLWS